VGEAVGDAVGGPDWDGGWAADRARKRRAWLTLTPGQRLAWLEDMLDLAAEVGALDADRARRAEAVRRAWEHPPPPSGQPAG
jgi:truncated hemoglobin YjbI